jgi:glutathione S-transferase
MAIGDHLADVKVLYGVAGCSNTTKCLFAAAEKGIDIEGKAVDVNSEAEMAAIKQISPFGTLPVLKDVDFYVYGIEAILSYIDDKGFGNSLVPRNGVARSQMYQWIHIAQQVLSPEVKKLTKGSSEALVIESIKATLAALEVQLNTRGVRGDYIVGELTLADIHWAPYIHNLCLHSHESLIDALPAVKSWWSKMKVRKSTSKENYVAFTVMPSLEEIRSNKLRSVSINN